MSKKTLFISVLAVILCFSFTLATLAATTSPKELLLKSIDNLDLSYNQKFYEQSSGNITYQINKFGGSSLAELNIPEGTSLDCNYKLDVPGKKSVIDVVLNYNNNSYHGQMYLAGKQIIFTKSIVTALQELAPQSELANLDQYPEFLYINYPVMTQVWSSMLDYPTTGVTEDTRDLIRFIVEAIPAEYFHASATTMTLELDQAGFEETVYSILQKVKNEKERFADIFVNMAAAYDTTGTMTDPQQMKDEMIKSIDETVNSGNWPTREQIQAMSAFIQVKQFKYQASIIPGGQSKFDVSLALQWGTGFTGQVDINSVATGKMDNRTGTYDFRLNFTEPGGSIINGALSSNSTYKNDMITQDLVFTASSQKTSGAVDFDVEITGKSTQQIESGLTVNVPALTAANSVNIEKYMNIGVIGGGSGSTNVEVMPNDKTVIFINNRAVATDAEPFMQNGRILVPIRFVAESLNGEISWIDPGEIRITRGDKAISMFADETRYIIDGRQATMDTAPVLKEGRVFVPVRFVAEALDCTVNYTDNKVYINTK